MTVSVQALTDKLGISKTAIYLYLKDPRTRRLGEATKKRIEEAIGEFQFHVNVNAKSLSEGKSDVIAILIPLNAPFFRNTLLSELLSGIQTILFKRGYKFIFIPTQGENSHGILRDQLKKSFGYDGYILFGTRACTMEDMRENVEHLAKLHLPFVVVNMPDLGFEVNQVINSTPRASSAVRHLLGLGHRRILLMAGSRNAPDTRLAVDEYRDRFAEAGLPVDERLIRFGEYERLVAKSDMAAVFEAVPDFTAVSCINDNMALGVYEALKERGLTIPGDVSVIGRDDSSIATVMQPALTTIRVPMYETGKTAAELLLRRLEHKDPVRKIVLENELILRESICPLREPKAGFEVR